MRLKFEYAAVPLAAHIFDLFYKSNAAKKHSGTLYGVAALMVARKFLHDEGDMCVAFVCVCVDVRKYNVEDNLLFVICSRDTVFETCTASKNDYMRKPREIVFVFVLVALEERLNVCSDFKGTDFKRLRGSRLAHAPFAVSLCPFIFQLQDSLKSNGPAGDRNSNRNTPS